MYKRGGEQRKWTPVSWGRCDESGSLSMWERCGEPPKWTDFFGSEPVPHASLSNEAAEPGQKFRKPPWKRVAEPGGELSGHHYNRGPNPKSGPPPYSGSV